MLLLLLLLLLFAVTVVVVVVLVLVVTPPALLIYASVSITCAIHAFDATCAGTKKGARRAASRLISRCTAETCGCTPALFDATLLFSHPYLYTLYTRTDWRESSCWYTSHCPPSTSARRPDRLDPTRLCPASSAWYHQQIRYSYETWRRMSEPDR
jgi:hypothetical protein